MREVHHSTSEQVEEYLREAWRIVFEMDLPENLQAVALPLVYNSVASKQVFINEADVSGGVLLAAPNPGNSRMQ